ncbi:sensory rhodopsin transducer [Sinorhizobium psoraleae]|uniref:sensory rhodopsin transducer n=1 Tax=Sinorhizobium psoraleae TaxID=520838 RepID=UPI00156A03F2|nr:sensory rhodopsin transducer [Sinorhizobium psoraleae]
MMQAMGSRRWAIADGYIPSSSASDDPALVSHESACILNAGEIPANIEITVFFSDREPAGPYRLAIAPRRTVHLRFNDLDDPERVPRDTPYACVIESDVPIIVQQTRLDSRRPDHALLSTIAYCQE